jgi:hypothetical protein
MQIQDGMVPKPRTGVGKTRTRLGQDVGSTVVPQSANPNCVELSEL